MLVRRPNSNDFDNTDIFNSKLKMKVTRITIVDNKRSMIRIIRFVLLYYTDIAYTQFVICKNLFDYTSKLNSNNSHIFIYFFYIWLCLYFAHITCMTFPRRKCYSKLIVLIAILR